MVNMLKDAIKDFTFERLARKMAQLNGDRKIMEREGYSDLSTAMHNKAKGIIEAVEALGYSGVEFHEYYRKNRSRYRKELREEVE